jgi:hypothetical protein
MREHVLASREIGMTVALHQFWGTLMSHQSRGCGLGHLC